MTAAEKSPKLYRVRAANQNRGLIVGLPPDSGLKFGDYVYWDGLTLVKVKFP